MKSLSLFTLAVCLFLSGCGFRESTIEWMQKESDIVLSPQIDGLVVREDHEAYKSLHCKIPKEEIINFAQRHKYSPSTPRNFYPIEFTGLPTTYTELSDLVYATGASDYTAWDSVLSLSTGDLWLAVSCPDFSGDLPPRALKRK